MGKPAYSIHFGDNVSAEITHRIQNFAEDVFYAIRDERLGSVENMDTAINEVFVVVEASRHLGRVRQIIESTLRQHHFEDAVIRRR